MTEELKNCRFCKGEKLITVVDFGDMFPSGFLRDDEKLDDSVKSPLTLCQCADCGLVQLKHCIDLDLMYRQYWYSSSLNKSMVSSLRDIVKNVESYGLAMPGDTVVDIGCNDGTLLGLYTYSDKLCSVGFDPALNLNKNNDSFSFVNNYFTKEEYPEVFGKANVITAIAMFYDLPDPVAFTKDVASILDDEGIFVVQFTDLVSMFKATAFDNICHEHLEYYRLHDVVNILNEAGLRAVDVSYNDVNGGSIRVTAAHRDSKILTKDIVIQSLVDEFNFLSSFTFDDFNSNIYQTVSKVKTFLRWCKETGKTVHLLGASTKGNTFLQVCGINNEDIKFAAEVNPDKFKLRTAGSNIPIISELESLILSPTHYIVPVWHFKDSLLKNKLIQDYIKAGGVLVFPLPKFSVVSENGEFYL